MSVITKKCKNCGTSYPVVMHNGKFWFDGEWVSSIHDCEECSDKFFT